jgi:peptidoglycan/LPS O-acetylase OafA/YrhL
VSAVKYRPDIDGLRAVAVLLVLVFHFRLTGGGKSGFMGVDMFFVISGFLITTIILKQLNQGTFSLQEFYVHRIRRLAPALFATTAMTMFLGCLILFPSGLVDLAFQGLWSQIYVANIYYWKTVNYFGLRSDDVFLLHTWSLAVEEQFYLLFPVYLMLAYRVSRKSVVWLLAIALVASFALNLGLVDTKPQATFYLLPTRAWELLIGSFACLYSTRRIESNLHDHCVGLIGVGLIAAAIVLFREEFRFPGAFALLPCLGTACLIVTGRRGVSGTSILLSLAPLVYVGRISYSLYLVHWPINVFAAYVFEDEYSLVLRFAMFLLSFGVASLIFHIAETPFRRRTILAGDGVLVAGYVAGLTVSILVFAIVIWTDGLPKRFPEHVASLANAVNDKPDLLADCEFDPKAVGRKTGYCRIGATDKAAEWLIVGDSHAWAAHSALDLWLRGRNEAAVFGFRHACLPIVGIHVFGDNGACQAFNLSTDRLIAENPQLTKVLLVSTWRQASGGFISDSDRRKMKKDEALALFDRQFSATLLKYKATGKQVVIWEPLPAAKRNVPISLAKAAMSHQEANIAFERNEYLREFAFFFSALEKNGALISGRFSPSQVLCGSGRCEVELDGRPLYFDADHLALSFSRFWAGKLEEQLGESMLHGGGNANR